MLNLNYTIESPPNNWKGRPLSFLRAAIPIINQYDNWDKANAALNRAKIHVSACPIIVNFNPVKVGLKTVSYDYLAYGNENLSYAISITIKGLNNEYLGADLSTSLSGKGIIKSEDGEIGSVRLLVKLLNATGVYDEQIVKFKEEQPFLFQEFVW